MHSSVRKILAIGYQKNLSRAREAPRFSRVGTFMRKRLTEDLTRSRGQIFQLASYNLTTPSDSIDITQIVSYLMLRIMSRLTG